MDLLTSLAIIVTNGIHSTKAILFRSHDSVGTIAVRKVTVAFAIQAADTFASLTAKFLTNLTFGRSQLLDGIIEAPIVNAPLELIDLS